jgi:hypothetical protein
MNTFLNFARPDRFLKPGRSLLLLLQLCFHAPAFAGLCDGLLRIGVLTNVQQG